MRAHVFLRSVWMWGIALFLVACQTAPPLRAGLTPEQVAALQSQGFSFMEDEDAMSLNLSGRMLFEVDSFEIRPQTLDVIDRITDTLRAIGIDAVRLDGHADSQGNPQYNLELSRQRAQAVAAAMAAQGFDPAGIEIRALGDTRPIADNATEEGRSANRRVSVVVRGTVH